MEIEEYRKILRELMDSGSEEAISNGQPIHAAAIYDLFFERAKYSVDIFCKDLSRDVFGLKWVTEAFRKALERGVTIRLLIQEELPEQKNILDKIKLPGLQVRYGDDNIKGFKFNFSVMDNRAYRYESDKQQCKAIAQLNDNKNSDTLNRTFSELWKQQED